MIEHAGMINHIYAKMDDLQITASSSVSQTASQSFDISIWQMLTPLLAGAQVNVYSTPQILNVSTFLQSIVKDRITVLQVVPSYLSEILLLAGDKNILADNVLEFVLSTGEELKYGLLEKWFKIFPAIKLVNAYGPTEASDDISHAIFEDAGRKGRVTLGRTLNNMRIYIVDKSGRLCPDGISGEIWVSGIGVGRGYIGLPEKTAAAFVPDPFHPGARVYRTGDIGRWNAEGNLEFYGRNDNQLKIRGHRVEPGEAEQVLLEFEDIRQAVVVARKIKGESFLCAYIIWKDTALKDINLLKAWLKNRLPEYMMPSFIREMDVFPFTTSGKIDRKKLPEPSPADLKPVHIAPRTALEKEIRDIWEEILGQDNIGMADNFFDLGGHSLKGIRLIAMIQDKLSVQITLKDVFQSPTPELQAKLIGALQWIKEEQTTSPAQEDIENILI
jgi:acyl-coenzyme A synthetase/AMP-(fatty) acid ligase/acyl carrier protein